ncbi:hypothetical protein U1Q18_018196 [Sarracenia purpurea var. burkii]
MSSCSEHKVFGSAMEEEEAGLPRTTRARYIKKKTLKNKALSDSFDEKDLRYQFIFLFIHIDLGFCLKRDFMTGFHKRKKKRRKEAEQQLQEVQHRKCFEDVKRLDFLTLFWV